MTVTVVGIDHRAASPAARAVLVMDAGQVDAGLAQIATLHPGVEALVLATCARTEIVVAGEGSRDAAATWHTLFAASTDEREACVQAPRVVLHGADAVRHVLRVAAGLDSPMLGDVDVLSQLRDAAARARAAGVLGPTLGRLVDDAIMIGRRARTETDIAAGAPSVAAAVTAELAEQVAAPEHVVVVGAGAVARGVVANLPAGTRVTVVNRTVGRAIDLVGARPGARAVALHRLDEVLATADAVVLAVSGGTVLATGGAAVADLVARHVPVVDAAAPRAVEPHDGLRLTPLERLNARRDATTARRAAAVPAVEVIVDEAVLAWTAAQQRTGVERAIAKLYSSTPDLVEALANATDEREIERTLARFLHEHVTALRAAPAGPTNR